MSDISKYNRQVIHLTFIVSHIAIGISIILLAGLAGLISLSWVIEPPFAIYYQNEFISRLLSGRYLESDLYEEPNIERHFLENMAFNPQEIIKMVNSKNIASTQGVSVVKLPWGATTVKGEDKDANQIPDKYNLFSTPLVLGDDFDQDGIPNQYEALNNTTPWWTCTSWDWTNRNKTNPFLSDSDFDGLSDGWEFDASKNGLKDGSGNIVIPPGITHPDMPDLFTEIDWLPGTKPYHDPAEIAWEPWVSAALQIIAGIGITFGFIKRMQSGYPPPWPDMIIGLSVALWVLTLTILPIPVTTIQATENYFKRSGINLHIIFDEEVTFPIPGDPSPAADFYSEWDFVTYYHTYPFAVYFIYGDPILGGTTHTSNDIRPYWKGSNVSGYISRCNFLGDFIFGHELFHDLGISENYFQAPGHYLGLLPLPFISPFVEDKEWNLIDLTNKGSTLQLWNG